MLPRHAYPPADPLPLPLLSSPPRPLPSRANQNQFEDEQQFALFHFRALRMDDAAPDEGDPATFEVRLGDCVSVAGGDYVDSATGGPAEHLLRVTEILYTAGGERLIRVNWFYKDVDTAMAVTRARRGVVR